jgi:hypothetical protein
METALSFRGLYRPVQKWRSQLVLIVALRAFHGGDYLDSALLEYDTKKLKTKTKLCGLSPRVNYADRATAACRRS